MFEQLPPHDIQAEESVVASLMVDAEAIHKVAPILEARDFFRESNAWTYEACRALWDRQESINQVTVAHELRPAAVASEDVGGLSFISDLVSTCRPLVGRALRRHRQDSDATYRKMISVSMNIAQVAYQGGPNLDEAMHKAEQLIYQLRSGGESSDFVHIREYLHPYLDPPDRDEFSPYAGRIRSGLSDLDKLLGGFNPSDLFIVAARTGVGKTALMLNFARNAAMDPRSPAKVAVFSLEMAGEQLAQRLLASESRIDQLDLQPFELQARSKSAHDERARAVPGDIYIDDSAGVQMPSCAPCIRLQRDHGLDSSWSTICS